MRKQTSVTNLRGARSRSSSRDHPAPFFSIFYRGLNKINKSQDHPDSAGDGPRSKGQSSPGTERKRTTEYSGGGLRDRSKGQSSPGTERKRTTEYSGGSDRKRTTEFSASDLAKYTQKPPLPMKSKNSVYTDSRDNRSVFATQPVGAGRSRVSKSATDLNKHQQQKKESSAENGTATAADRNGTSDAPRGSFLTRRFPMLSSAPSSPTPKPRRGIFGSFGEKYFGEKSHSAAPDGNLNGHLNGGPINGIDDDDGVEYDAPAKLSFSQRIKLHKGVRTGKIPIDVLRYTHHKSQQVIPNVDGVKVETKDKKEKKGKAGKKAVSVDTGINELDTDHLAEALLAIADEQPLVARSTPKHAVLGPDQQRKTRERLRKNCIYEPGVYEKMINDSVQICDLLQSHLNECIVGVRAHSPTALSSPFTTPPGTPMLSRSASSQPIYGGRAFSPLLVHPPRVTISISNGVPPYAAAGSPSHRPGHFPVVGPFTPGASLPPLPTTATSSGNVSPTANYVPIRRPTAMAGPKTGDRRFHFSR